MNAGWRALLAAACFSVGANWGVPCAAAAGGVAAQSEDRASRKPSPVFVEVLVLLATNDGKGIDPRAKNLDELRRPPFSSFNSYAVLDEARIALVAGKASELRLPNQRVLVTTLLEQIDSETIRLSASINGPKKGKDYLPLLEVKAKLGQRFIVAGQSHGRGTLVLVIRPTR